MFLMKFYEVGGEGWDGGWGGGGGLSDTSPRVNTDSMHINKCDTSAAA